MVNYFCSQCGEAMAPNARFCTRCGTPRAMPATSPPEARLLEPVPHAHLKSDSPITFKWTPVAGANYYKVDVDRQWQTYRDVPGHPKIQIPCNEWRSTRAITTRDTQYTVQPGTAIHVLWASPSKGQASETYRWHVQTIKLPEGYSTSNWREYTST